MARDTSDTSDTSAQMDLSGYSRVAQDCRQPASPRLRAMVSGRVANVGEWCDHHADRLSRERAALVASIARAERLSSGGSAAAREMADRLVADRSARIAEIDGLLAEIAAYRAGTDTDPDRLGERPIRTPSQTRATVAVQGIGIEGYRAVFVADGVETHHHDFERRHGHTLAQAKKQAIGMLRAIIARHRGRGDHRVHLHALRLVDTTTPEQYRVGYGPQYVLTPDPTPVFSLWPLTSDQGERPMPSMEPYTYHGAYWRVDTLLECFIVPTDVAGPNASADDLSQYAPEYVSPDAFDQIEDWKVELRTGWYGRYSADGYLDCTDWEAADSEEELLSTLRDLYGDNDSEESAS